MPTEALKEPFEKLCCHVCFDHCRGKPHRMYRADFKLPHNVQDRPHTPVHPIQADGYFL
jgi:hypothetical protein